MDKLLNDVGIAESVFEQVHSYKGKNFLQAIIKYNSIINYLRDRALYNSDDPFVIEIRNGKQIKNPVSYKQFYDKVKCISKTLKEKYNIDKNSYVAILPENSIESIYIIYAVMYNHALAVIINPNEPKARILSQINKFNCALTIIDKYSYQIDQNMGLCAQDLVLESEKLPETDSEEKYFDPQQGALIIFTTGSTSDSKPVLQMHYNIAINSCALVQHHQLNKNQKLLCALPICHVNGLEFTIFATMVAGSTVVLCDAFDPSIYLSLINKYHITLASLVPPMLNAILDENLIASDYPMLRYFVTAAAPLSSKTSNGIWQKFRKRIVQGYGLTETTNFSTLMSLDINDTIYRSLMIDCDIPSVGSEIFGNEVTILRNDGSQADIGEEGEICMRGHNVMAGYLFNPDATKKSFDGGWFHSGDIGKFTVFPSVENKFLVITGRIKNIIKVNGHAVSLEEIDRLILGMNFVYDCVTCAMNDKEVGEVPLSFVVRKNESLSEENILDTLAKYLSYQSLPKAILFVAEIPRMKNGKVNRSVILEKLLKADL